MNIDDLFNVNYSGIEKEYLNIDEIRQSSSSSKKIKNKIKYRIYSMTLSGKTKSNGVFQQIPLKTKLHGTMLLWHVKDTDIANACLNFSFKKIL